MLPWIIGAVLLICYYQYTRIKQLEHTQDVNTPVLVRYIEACQWLAGLNVPTTDIYCYAHRLPSVEMIQWGEANFKNVMEVSGFREYVKAIYNGV